MSANVKGQVTSGVLTQRILLSSPEAIGIRQLHKFHRRFLSIWSGNWVKAAPHHLLLIVILLLTKTDDYQRTYLMIRIIGPRHTLDH